MNVDLAMFISKNMLWTMAMVSLPVILVAVVVGLVMSILQVVTQVQDATISFVPKILCVVLVLAIAGTWMLHKLMAFTSNLITQIPNYI